MTHPATQIITVLTAAHQAYDSAQQVYSQARLRFLDASARAAEASDSALSAFGSASESRLRALAELACDHLDASEVSFRAAEEALCAARSHKALLERSQPILFMKGTPCHK